MATSPPAVTASRERARAEDGVLLKEQRSHPRVADPFAVTLVSSQGLLGSHKIDGVAKNYSADGLCVISPAPLASGTKVRIRLRLPRTLSEFFRGLPCELRGRVAGARRPKTASASCHELIVAWEKPLPQALKDVIAAYQRKIGALVGLTLVVVIWAKWRTLDYFWYTPFFYVYSLTLLTYLVSRFYLSWRHRSPKMTNYTPTLSVIISVRNEEAAIARTVETCYRTDYPPALLEVIVIDDGSTDATPRVLAELKRKFANLRIITLSPSGKRHAMAAGVLKSTGEIIVFVDSDTFLMPDALRQIVCGFEDPALGASAGYTEVENASVNALTGLQEVRYFVSYRLLKSSESLYDCVTCCPGCLSAYRRKYVLEILQPWLHQTFLGAPATFGDDRSLTNFILRKYRVIYNDKAVASTLVPENWTQYMRQQVRWKKSWLRETLIAASFMHRKHPIAAISFYAASLFSLMSPAMVLRVVYLEVNGHDAVFVSYMLGLLLIAFLQSVYFLYKRPSPHWVLGMLWMASSLVLTGPQTYYALLTMRKNHWGTR